MKYRYINYSILVRIAEGKKLLVKPRHGWAANTTMDIQKGVSMWTVFIWLKISGTGGLL
jgi:hypothetical protein